MAWTDMTQLTGLVAWYKPETLAATYANGDPISTWADSSGNSRDLTGTTTTRPLAAASAINGYMAADFDGTDDVLEYTAGYSFTSAPLAACIVYNADSLSTNNGLISVDDAYPIAYPSSHMGLRFDSADQRYINYLQAAGGTYSTNTHLGTAAAATDLIATAAGDATLGYCCGSGGVVSMRNDINATGRPGMASATLYWMIGNAANSGGMPLNGKIAEVVMWSSSNWHSERFWVEGYLADKYAITLADGHLFKNEPPASAPTTYNTGSGVTNVAAAKFTRLE